MDLIVSGKNGWLFRDGDARQLAAMLEKLVQSREWTRLDRTGIRQSAHRAREVAVEWAGIYERL